MVFLRQESTVPGTRDSATWMRQGFRSSTTFEGVRQERWTPSASCYQRRTWPKHNVGMLCECKWCVRSSSGYLPATDPWYTDERCSSRNCIFLPEQGQDLSDLSYRRRLMMKSEKWQWMMLGLKKQLHYHREGVWWKERHGSEWCWGWRNSCIIIEKEANEKWEMAVNDVGAEETVASSDDILIGMFYVNW